VTTSPPWRTTLFDEEGLADVQRKFFGTLLNTYAFFTLYANIDGFTFAEERIPVARRPEIDRWVISSLNSLVRTYTEALDAYDVTKAAWAVSAFTLDQLSNWYVRRNRRRFWKSEKGDDKLAAYQTLHECLSVLSRLIAPYAPFLAERLYQNLEAGTGRAHAASVHIADIPVPDASAIDAALEARMEKTQRIVSLVRAIRNKANLKVRQPLGRIILPIAAEEDRRELAQMEATILEEINVKKIEYVHGDEEIVRKSAKPNFKSLGPKHGKGVQPVAAALKALTPEQIRQLERDGRLTLPVAGTSVEVTLEDVEILHEDIKGWLVESDGRLTVALDTQLTPELVNEGLAREFVNRVQNLRKDAGFAVTDRIRINVRSAPKLKEALRVLSSYIKSETLAVELLESAAPAGEGAVDFDINGEACSVRIEKIGENGAE
jgi:isoleucyl-tRNA synthetase